MNDIERAIETLKDMKGVFGTRSHKQYSLSALDLAISALEKQIPYQVDCISTTELPWKDGCCKCGEYTTDTQVYCCNCGQALDWSVEE